MARRVAWVLLAGLAVPLMSLGALAAEPKKGDGSKLGEPRSPETLLNRIDKNHDGAITEDEIPPGAPERVKALIKKADKNGDKKVTLDELKAAMKAPSPAIPAPGTDRPRPPEGKGPQPPQGGPEGHHGLQPARHEHPHGVPPTGPQAMQAPKPPQGGRGPMPDMKAVFATMDKNRDGSLSFEEFAAGMAHFHQLMNVAPKMGSVEPPRRPGPGPQAIDGPRGMERPFGAPWAEGYRGPMGGPGPQAAQQPGCPCPWCQYGPAGHGPAFGYGPHPWGGPGPFAGPGPWGAPGWRHGPFGGPQPWAQGPEQRPEQAPSARAGGPDEEHLKKVIAKLVRDEVDKVLKEKADAAKHQPKN